MRRRAGLWICFFLSGVSGLLYEVVWMRRLGLVFGSTAFAVSTVLAAFMGGLALGSLAFGRYADRFRRPLAVYGLMELGIGGYALLVPGLLGGLAPLYRALWAGYEPSFYTFSLLRFFLSVGLLLPPTVLMGGTLPALSRWAAARAGDAGRGVGALYSVNTWGAVAGAGAAGFFLLRELGMSGATWVAVALNAGAGVWALWMAGGEADVFVLSAERAVRAGGRSHPRWIPRMVLGAFALSGAVAMVYEVAWTRLLTLVVGSSTYAFSAMLATFLAGLALGSAAMVRQVDRLRSPVWAFGALQVGLGLSVLAGAYLFGALPHFFLLLFPFLSGSPALMLLGKFLICALIMLVPTCLLGAGFPLTVRIYTGGSAAVGRRVGGLYAANAAGTVVGAFAAGFLLLPALGIQGSITLGMALNLCTGLCLIAASEEERAVRVVDGTIGFTVTALVAVFLVPEWHPLLMSGGVYRDAPAYLRLYRKPEDAFRRLEQRYRLLFYREGPTATVSVVERPALEDRRHLVLSVDGKADASTAADMSTQVLSGHLPFLLGAETGRALVVGLASGVTVGAVTRHPVQTVKVVEIEPAVVAASRCFEAVNGRPLDDSRVSVRVDDARSYLLVGDGMYDVIISEPSNPWMSGPSRLFTKAFFELGRERLRPGGIFAQWFQLYGMRPALVKALLRTFRAVFPHVLVFRTGEADLILLGSDRELKLNEKLIRQRMALDGVARDLARVGVNGPADLVARFVLGTAEVDRYAGSGPLNTDDNGLIEFGAPQDLYAETVAANLNGLEAAYSGLQGYLAGGVSGQVVDLALPLLREQAWARARRLAQDVDSPGARWALGEAARGEGREEEALAAWKEALADDPCYAPVLMSLALFHLRWTDYAVAEGYFRRLAECGIQGPVVDYYHGINLYFLGRGQAAVAKLRAALQERLTGEGTIGNMPASYFLEAGPEQRRFVNFYLGLAYEKIGKPREAAQMQRQFVEDLVRWREALEERLADLSALPAFKGFRARAAMGLYVAEDDSLLRLIDRYVGAPLTHYYAGATAYFLGYYGDAVEHLRVAVRLMGDRASRSLAHYFLGMVHAKQGDERLAREHLGRFLAHLRPEMRNGPKAADAAAFLRDYRAFTFVERVDRRRR